MNGEWLYVKQMMADRERDAAAQRAVPRRPGRLATRLAGLRRRQSARTVSTSVAATGGR